MTTTTEKVGAGKSSRISCAVRDLLDSAPGERVESVAEAVASAVDDAFSAPAPLEWLIADVNDSDHSSDDLWNDTTGESRRSGIIRTYTESGVTGASQRSAELEGLRITHKDNIGIAGYPLTAGTPALADHRAEMNSPLLTASESAGGAIIGANHMAEFAMSPTGHNHWLGDGVNPLNDAFLSGGSSSGSAISVASGSSDLSLGTDTGGSVRLPAAFCGLVGYKPTNGIFSTTGLLPLSETLDTIGLLAADAKTVRRVAEVLFSNSAVVDRDSRSRLEAHSGSDAFGFAHLSLPMVAENCDAEVTAAFSEALTAIGQASDDGGIETGEDISPGGDAGERRTLRATDFDDSELNRRSVVIVSVEAARNVGRVLRWNWDLLGDQVLSRVIRGTAISAIEYADALAQRAPLTEQFLAEAMQGSRFMLTPTSPILAPKASTGDEAEVGRAESDYMRASRFTRIINYLGLPAVTVPLPAIADSLSPGLQIIGRPYDDQALLDCAARVAEACT
ncbi:amidase [Brevibacterium oceani]|uniref:amidase n=1 Tax=Brevibacterium oceani TaxID=358099 RepID=UPI001B33DD46|nr:amidase [Brevibacterium oceani]